MQYEQQEYPADRLVDRPAPKKRRKAGLRIGFDFVPFPRAIWDEDISMTLAEFRLLGYVIRHTVTFGNARVRLTDDELMQGRKRKDGSRMDAGCGVKGVNNLKEARSRLLARGWIALAEDLSDRARPRREYWCPLTDDEPVSETDNALSETDIRVSVSDSWVSETDDRLSETDTRTYTRDFRERTEREREGTASCQEYPRDPSPPAPARSNSSLPPEAEDPRWDIAMTLFPGGIPAQQVPKLAALVALHAEVGVSTWERGVENARRDAADRRVPATVGWLATGLRDALNTPEPEEERPVRYVTIDDVDPLWLEQYERDQADPPRLRQRRQEEEERRKAGIAKPPPPPEALAVLAAIRAKLEAGARERNVA